MAENLIPSTPIPDVNPNAVFAALDKVVAETTLATRLRGGEGAAESGAAMPDSASDETIHVGALRNSDNTVATAAVAKLMPIRTPAAPPVSEMPRATTPVHTPPAPATALPIVEANAVRPHDNRVAAGQPLHERANLIAIALVVVVAIAAVEAWLLVRDRQNRTPVPAAAAATVAIESTPAGAEISIDGKARGKTPATLALDPGHHTLDLASGTVSRRLPLIVEAGISRTEHAFLDATGTVGPLLVSSHPAGARVTIDGSARGVTPLSISNLQQGSHAVVVEVPASAVRQDVPTRPGTSPAPNVAVPSAAASAGGWLTISAPIAVQLFEGSALLGSSESPRIMVPAGRHVIDAVNAALGYKATKTVQVAAGSTSALTLDMPGAPVAINAIPWAEVAVDGRGVGTTPLANVSIPIGAHEIVFTHPQLGERRQNVVVSLKTPNRITANLNQR